MRKLPTDIQILKAIYDTYYHEFIAYEKRGGQKRSSKMYVPIDIEKISRMFGADSDLIFGRLYYHLENKFGYKDNDGGRVHFFALRIGSDIHCVHFPYLASVLATMKSENRKFIIATTLSIAALIISLVAIFLN